MQQQLGQTQNLVNALRVQLSSKVNRKQVTQMVDTVKDSILATVGDAGEDDGTSTVVVKMDLIKTQLASMNVKIGENARDLKMIDQAVAFMNDVRMETHGEVPTHQEALWEKYDMLEEQVKHAVHHFEKMARHNTEEFETVAKSLRVAVDDKIHVFQEEQAKKPVAKRGEVDHGEEDKAVTTNVLAHAFGVHVEEEGGMDDVPPGFGWALRRVSGRVNTVHAELAAVKASLGTHANRLKALESQRSGIELDHKTLKEIQNKVNLEMGAVLEKAEGFHTRITKCDRAIRALQTESEERGNQGGGNTEGNNGDQQFAQVDEDALFAKLSDVVANTVSTSARDTDAKLSKVTRDLDILTKTVSEAPKAVAETVDISADGPEPALSDKVKHREWQMLTALATANRTITSQGNNIFRHEQLIEQLQVDVVGKADGAPIDKLVEQQRQTTEEINELGRVIDKTNVKVLGLDEEVKKCRRDKAGKRDVEIIEADIGEIMDKLKKINTMGLGLTAEDANGSKMDDKAKEDLEQLSSQMVRFQKRQTSIAWAVVTLAGGSREAKLLQKIRAPGDDPQVGFQLGTTPRKSGDSPAAMGKSIVSEGKGSVQESPVESSPGKQVNPNKASDEKALTAIKTDESSGAKAVEPMGEPLPDTLDNDWALLMQAWDDMIAATQLKPKANFALSTELCDQVNTSLYHLARHESQIQEKMDRQECMRLLDHLRSGIGDNAIVSSITSSRALHHSSHKGSDKNTICMACHQHVADPVAHQRMHTDEAMNQAKGYNVADRTKKFKNMNGSGEHQTDPRLVHPPVSKSLSRSCF